MASSTIKVGSKVKCSAQRDVYGTHLAAFVRKDTFVVLKVNGDKITIGKGKTATAVVKKSTLKLVGGTKKTNKNKDKKKGNKLDTVNKGKNDKLTAKQIDSQLKKMLYANNTEEILKYNMRLFGIPHQFTRFCDYRTYTIKNRSKNTYVGRKFIENIMLEAPVVTIVPGKPLYLPAAKNKRGLSYTLLSAANGSVSGLVASKEVDKNKSKVKYQRYYDFQQDYYGYMKYVNILCAVGAAFLDLNDEKLVTGINTPMASFDWKNYRWKAESYTTSASNILTATKSALKSFANTLKTYGKSASDKVSDKESKSTKTTDVFKDKENESVVEKLESLLAQTNFVQFYVDPSTGFSESGDNSTGESKLAGMMNAGSELSKEVAFLADSGGMKGSDLSKMVSEGLDELNDQLFSKNKGAIGGVLSRMLGTGSNIIKGDNMIIPEIYQSSKYTKSYNLTVDLRTPYGNKKSYYLNILVPLFHLIALAMPRQTTANTYKSPCLVKAYFPGIFACNLGIVSSIQIDKNPNGDSWTADGLPSHVRATLTIVDLYADLTLTPAGVGSIALFLANSSLIEYISTNCGVNLTTPQLSNRINTVITTVTQAFETVKQDIGMSIQSTLNDLVDSLVGA